MLLGASVFILTIFWLLLYFYIFPTIKNIAHTSLTSQLQILQQDSIEDLQQLSDSLKRLSDDLYQENIDVNRVDELVENFKHYNSSFDRISVIDNSLHTIYEKPIQSEIFEVANEQYVEKALNSGGVVFSGILYNDLTQIHYISLYVPISLNGDTIGVLKGTFKVEENFFNPTITNAKLGETGNVFLVDGNGYVFTPNYSNWLGNDNEIKNKDELVISVQNTLNQVGVLIQEYTTISGEEKLLATTQLNEEMIIGIYYDLAELYGPKIQLEKAFILITVLTLTIVILVGLWINQKISIPLLLLSEQADKIAKGDFKAPFPIKRDSETDAIINALKRVLKEKDLLLVQTIQTISKTLEKKDAYTAGHSERVTNYALGIASNLQLSEHELETLQLGALLHDIGKIGVPDFILTKDGKLTEEEFAEIKMHTIYGDEIIKSIKSLHHIRPIIRSHHERWDGNGYPDGLKGTEIHLLARITCVADAFDAMTSNRPYRKGMDSVKAREIIKKEAGKQFDPIVVNAFLKYKLK